MAEQFTARQGDTLDGLLWRERGLQAVDLATVLDANPGVAGLGEVLPAGTVVTLPASLTSPGNTTLAVVQLWD